MKDPLNRAASRPCAPSIRSFIANGCETIRSGAPGPSHLGTWESTKHRPPGAPSNSHSLGNGGNRRYPCAPSIRSFIANGWEPLSLSFNRINRTLLLASLFSALLTACSPPRPDHPVIGAKNFTEQVVLGELLAQEIEAKSHLQVERRFYLAGSYICHQALVSGRIDAYVEYSGTALTAILKQPLADPGPARDPARVLSTVRSLYATRYNIVAAQPLGFENTFAMVIRAEDARRLHLTTLSQAARYSPQWRLGVGYEFEQRPDGLPGLSAAYGLHFAAPPRTMDLGLLYRALEAHQVDMIAANSTDGPIQALGLTALEDDKHYFPPYQAVPLVRAEALQRWPQIQTALDDLAGNITAEDMRAMNEAIDGQHRDPADVVREFRTRKGL